MKPYRVRAKNTAVLSDNKMHDDAVAATYGFKGGLVPGVDVYAYLCHLPAERWGRRWLEHGTMQARFISPVYDGEELTIVATDRDDDSLDFVLCGEDGTERATGRAGLSHAAPPHDMLPLRDMPERSERLPAEPDVVARLDVLGSTDVGFDATRADDYLDDIGEHDPLFRHDRLAHPGWLLRQANFVLSGTVRLGPWIHVSSECVHAGAVDHGERVTTRARVRETYERKGHHFVDLDVHWVAGPTGGERLVMHGRHLAIFRPRTTP